MIYKDDLLTDISAIRSQLEYEYGGGAYPNLYDEELDFDRAGFDAYLEESPDTRAIDLREMQALLNECDSYRDDWDSVSNPQDDIGEEYVIVEYRGVGYKLSLED